MSVRTYDGPVLISPDRLWRSYASVETKPEGDAGCSNFSILWIQGPSHEAFQIVHTVKPEPYLRGNGLKLVSWAPQRHLLAVKVSFGQYASDAGGNSVSYMTQIASA